MLTAARFFADKKNMETLSNLHPVVVHFPMAFFILFFVLEFSGVIFKKEFLSKTSDYVLALAVIFSVIAVLTGNQSYEEIKKFIEADKEIKNAVDLHEQFATISVLYFALLFFLRIYLKNKKKFTLQLRYLFIFLAAIGCVVVFYTGLYGGKLVFDFGVGTKLFGN